AIDPEGPYLLGGWSMGGIVALEMAQQLQKRGFKVALLALLDCQVPGPEPSGDSSHTRQLIAFIVHLLGSFPSHLSSFQQFEGQQFTELYQTLQPLPEEQQIVLILDQLKQANIIPEDVELAQFKHLIAVFRTNYQAVRSYRAESYAGRVIFFGSEEVIEYKGLGPAMGWDHLIVGDKEIYTLPGNHYALMRGLTVHKLAERLSAATCKLP
ncbi:MAG TPA: thioesterase domain-containing protein, partial [Ktedonobacteraceae bacterium]|nr:thioesterase domain-containing protein [Ktedonobacteraceae bacterium]